MASLKVKVVDSEPAEAIGVAVPEKDAAKSRATVAVVKVVDSEPAEEIGVAVPEKDVAESRATVAVVKAVEPAETIG